ncbi:MAG: type II 3-dehydroquinate dehydratase [Eubacteriales bacterium]
MKIAVINGPNLNLLGKREPTIYGSQTLEDINTLLSERATKEGVELSFFQSNHEGELVEELYRARLAVDGVVINAAAYTHTSVAIRDAVSAIDLPVIEVHLSNVHKREEFRHHSYLSAVSVGVICGFGAESYWLGILGLKSHLEGHK